MAIITEISPENLVAFDSFIPELLKSASLSEAGYRFYGIIESEEAAGSVIMKITGDEARLRYLYIIPHLRGTGVMDQCLSQLFIELWEEGIGYVRMDYFPEEFETLRYLSERFGFTEKSLPYSYVRFGTKEITARGAGVILFGIAPWVTLS